MPRLSPRWIVLVVIALVALLLWRSGLLAELSLEGLKSRQDALQAWTAANPWLAAGAFFVIYVLVTGALFVGINLLVDLLLPFFDPRIRESQV